MTDERVERVELITPGTLGTCWYGKYHYLEPWTGCEHDCLYCYARFRSVVTGSLKAGFTSPQPLLPPEELLATVRDRLAAGDVKILKLCRYTDFFPACFVKDGLAARLLQVLLDSPVERLIITTKGVPDEACLSLMAARPAKVSYNVVAKPTGPIELEPGVRSVTDRLKAAAFLHERGVLTTVHMDPLLAGLEDGPRELTAFLEEVQRHGLRRVMFSFLLLNPPMIDALRKRLKPADVKRVLKLFDIDATRQYLPAEAETVYFAAQPAIRQASAERLARLLRARGLEFVLCSLKNRGKEAEVDRELCPLCDGTFYA